MMIACSVWKKDNMKKIIINNASYILTHAMGMLI